MTVPAVMFLEMAMESASLDESIAAAEVKEVRELGDARLDQIKKSFAAGTSDFEMGYVFALRVARILLRLSPPVVQAGLTEVI